MLRKHRRLLDLIVTAVAAGEIPGSTPSARRNGSRLRSIATVVLGIALFVWGAWWQLFCLAVMKRFNFLDFGRFYYAARGWREGGSFL